MKRFWCQITVFAIVAAWTPLFAQPGIPGGDLPGGAAGASPQFADMGLRNSLALTGRVTLEDGTVPPEPVVIEMNCNGQTRPQGHTNLKGKFSISPGNSAGIVTGDASMGGVPGGPGGGPGSTLANDGFDSDPLNQEFGGLGGRTTTGMNTVDLKGCEIRARLAGYRSSVIALGRRSLMGNTNVGTIVLRRLGAVPGTSVSVTTLQAPKDARKYFEKALNEMGKANPKPKKAIEELENAVEIYPSYAAAWSMLGDLRMKMRDAMAAGHALRKAIEADASYLPPYLPLIRMDLANKKWESALDLSSKLVRLNPYLAEARYCHAVASLNTGDPTAAERSLTAMDEGMEDFPPSFRLLAFLYARKGDVPRAAEQLRKFMAAAPHDPFVPQVQGQLAEWEASGALAKAENPTP